MALKSVDYYRLEKEKEIIIQRTISQKLANQTLGKIDSLKHAVLMCVVKSDYSGAIEYLDRFVLLKAHFPNFALRSEGLFRHSKELINAIEMKRNLPGLASLNVSRQQEMLDSVITHFEELKGTIKQIERIATDCALEDLRSTVWVLRTLSYVTIAIVGAAFFMDFTDTLGQPFIAVYNDFSDKLWGFIEPFI